MSTVVSAAPAAPKARQATASSKSFVLSQGEVHSFQSPKLEQPLMIRVVVAEVGTEFMTINGKPMNGPRLVQTVAPPPDPCSHQSERLRSQDKRRAMPRSEYRWTYVIPGVVRFELSEVESDGKPAVRFEVDPTY